MRHVTILALLFVSALLEAGGDAIVRLGIHAGAGWTRVSMLCAGALALFAYGCLVNASSWDFGRVMGVYIVCFFLVAQAIAWLVFGQPPPWEVWLGGTLIVIGGAIISLGNR